MATIQKTLSKEEIREFKEIFSLVDTDGSGEIDEDELAELMQTLGLVPSKEEIKEMMKEVDFDGNGLIDFDEFCTVMSSKVETSYSQKDLVDAFKIFEGMKRKFSFEYLDEEPGFVNTKKLIRALMTYGNLQLSEREAMELISALETESSDKINYMEHIQMLSNVK